MSLVDLIAKPAWTPRVEFPPSRMLVDGPTVSVFTCDNGLYLMTNRNFGERDPVWGVGWAESDYWAKRVWGSPSLALDLGASPPARWPLPQLTELGRPADLSYGSVLDYERSRPGARPGLSWTANYRMTDGAFRNVELCGVKGRVRHYFASSELSVDDLPVAIEFRLPRAV